MARIPTELTVLLDRNDPEKSALRLKKEGCLADGADLAKVTDLIASAFSAALERGPGFSNPLHDAADALGNARLLSARGAVLWRKNHEPPPWWKFWK